MFLYKPIEKTKTILLFLYVVAYALQAALAGSVIGLNLNKIIILPLIPILLRDFFRKKIRVYKPVDVWFVTMTLIFCTSQIVFLHSTSVIKMLVNLFFFYVFFKTSDAKLLNTLCFAVKICAIIGSLSVLFLCIKSGSLYYLRLLALIDKSYLTIFFSITFCACIVDLFFGKSFVFNVLTLAFVFALDLLVIQSKTSLLIFFMVPLLIVIFSSEFRKRVKRFIPYVCLLGVFCVFLCPHIELPEDVKFGVNRMLGMELFSSSTFVHSDERLSLTYDIRNGVKNYCWQLFYDHPVLGIGYGMFASYNKSSTNFFRELNETESTFYSVLVEGGLMFVFCYIVLIFSMILFCYKKIKNKVENDQLYLSYLALLYFVALIILLYCNDFSDAFFWISTGVFAGSVVNEKRSKI